MAIAEMRKVTIIGHLADRAAITGELQRAGVMELEAIEEETESGPGPGGAGPGDVEASTGVETGAVEQRIAELKFCIDFLDKLERVKKGLIQQFAGSKIPVDLDEFGNMTRDEGWFRPVHSQCRDYDSRLSALRNEENQIQNLLRQLAGWVWLDLPLEELGGTRHAGIVLGSVAAKAYDNLASEARSACDGLYIEARRSDDGRDVYFVVIYAREDEQALFDVLKKHEYTRHQFPALTGTPRECAGAARQRLDAISGEREGILGEARKLLSYRTRIYALYDSLSLERDRLAASRQSVATRRAFAIQGWVASDNIPALRDLLMKRFDSIVIKDEPPADGEAVPVTLKNTSLVTPFEAVTEIYSMPHPEGIDPTPWLAPFFFVFFGMCLGDVGYGILLTLLCVILLKKIRMAGLGKKLFILLAISGVSSAVMGAVTGSWLGNLVKVKPLWFNPLDNPILMLGVSFALGLIQILVGLGIKFGMNVRRGRIVDAVFDQGFWFLLILGLALIMVSGQVKVAGISTLATWLSAVGAVGLIATQGRANKGIIKRLASGVLSLYGITGYLSDVLSYSRLLALGLASSVIANVIDDLALRLTGIPILGWIGMVILLVVGHTFNLLINVVGSFVHSSRLQYVEFFNKFFEGGGRRFSPFRVRTKYIDIDDIDLVGEREA
ncbi:MAG: V-type ATP synthase subunit I [Firmicutes bacterium]|nr:V-type ATP synthase subunit I [Bacillota bacterium]